MPVNKLTLASGTVTGPGAQPGLAVGSITGDYTVKLFISSFSEPGANARIAIEEAASNAFSPAEQLVVWNFNGGSLPTEGVMVSFRKREAAGTDLAGEAGSYLRVNVQELAGYIPSLTYDAWIEY